MGIRREEEMECRMMTWRTAPESKDSDESGIHRSWLTVYKQKIKTCSLKQYKRYSLIVLRASVHNRIQIESTGICQFYEEPFLRSHSADTFAYNHLIFTL